MPHNTPRTLLTLTLCLTLLVAPGCIVGSPVSAISGEPYGMTRDDVGAIGGKKRPIWGGHPVAAAIDLPFAFVLDTVFLPISLLIWGIKALAGSDDRDDGHSHGHDDEH